MQGLDLGFFSRARVPLMLQSEAAECGLACVAMIASWHGHRISLAELRLQRPISLKGLALDGVIDVARQVGLQARALRLDCGELKKLKVPCVLHWRMNHFVVLESVSGHSVHIVDPACGRRRVSHRECAELFTGVALELLPAADFARRKETRKLELFDMLRGQRRIVAPLLQVLALSVAIQVFALAMPAYLQLAIDQVVPTHDKQLLVLLALSFAAIAILHAVTSAIRAWCIFCFGTRLNFGWTAALFHRLLHQPLAYFEARSTGDIQSRFGSIQPLRELVSSRTIETIVDGVMAITTGIVIVLYGRHLAIVVIATILLYAVVRVSMFPLIRQRSMEQLVANADVESHLLESIRGAVTIKNFGIETQRLVRYRNRIADALNAAARIRRLTVAEKGIETGLFSVQGVLVVYVGVGNILAAEMTVGMLVAFLAYAGQFSSRSVSLIQGLLDFRLIRIHLDRIADIVDSVPEPNIRLADRTAMRPRPIDGAVEVRQLWFRYGGDAAWVLRDLSFSVLPGECVGLAAPSGFGKTTLLKVMVGLLRPYSGESRFDGVKMTPDNGHELRRQFGVVMQQDRLLAGSVAQNIAAFDEVPDQARIVTAARLACVDNDIAAMPMRYLTLVGDMGDVFSGGQKQRILLARALYRMPRILFLDEATSHLDNSTEKLIAVALSKLPITRIIIAHRHETLAICDRVIDLAELNPACVGPLEIHA